MDVRRDPPRARWSDYLSFVGFALSVLTFLGMGTYDVAYVKITHAAAWVWAGVQRIASTLAGSSLLVTAARWIAQALWLIFVFVLVVLFLKFAAWLIFHALVATFKLLFFTAHLLLNGYIWWTGRDPLNGKPAAPWWLGKKRKPRQRFRATVEEYEVRQRTPPSVA